MRKVLCLLYFICAVHAIKAQTKYTDYVNPFIGTGGHGHVFLGASVPFGGVQVGPNNRVKGWDWCSGYHYSDSIVIGFSQTHLSGTGIGDLGDILMMPYTGAVKIQSGDLNQLGYASHYTHAEEKATPGYYSVYLKDYDIHVELTATERTALHHYRFPGLKDQQTIIDLNEGISDKTTACYIKKIDTHTLEGYRFSSGWAKDQKVFFVIQCSSNLSNIQYFKNDLPISQDSAKGKSIKAVINFSGLKDVYFKVGISAVSCANALKNIKEENVGWDFESIKKEAIAKWEKELSKITTHNTKKNTVFYTSLYHTMIAPSIFNDVNGDYRGLDKQTHHDKSFVNYTTFSLWDTYRSWWPLTTILHQDRVNDFINSLLAKYKDQNRLPIWPLMENETDCMIGYHSVPLIVDAYLKGFNGFDTNQAFDAIIKTSNREAAGIKELKAKGFIPAETEVYSVSKALEYAIDDHAIAMMAKKLNQSTAYSEYDMRSKLYKNYFDSSTGFMRPRTKDGNWKANFDPFESNHENGDFVEGNSWQYTWLVPHDVHGLIHLFGSDQNFCTKLDSLFIVSGFMGKEASSDITGLIGMYAHGNEPSHHIAYLYAYAGEQWKTAARVREIMSKFYTDQPDGLAGNEDCGAMSSWYIYSALGFYPVDPTSGIYVFGSPLLSNYTIHLPANKKFEVLVKNNSDQNIYIDAIELNGKRYTKSYLKHSDLLKGGKMVITMRSTPNYNFGKDLKDRP